VRVEPEKRDIMGPGWEEHREARRRQQERWEVRAAEWKVLELARHVFGAGTGIRLSRHPGRGAFRGLLHLEVPFRSLKDHRFREHRFLALAAREELLTRVPVVYVFDPVPTTEVGPVLEPRE
jgi:hypothetical protein